MATAIARSEASGLMAQSAVKAAAVERLMPAQQWTTIGPSPPQVERKVDDLRDMVLVGGDVLGQRLCNVVHHQAQVIVGLDQLGRLHQEIVVQAGQQARGLVLLRRSRRPR